MIDLASMSSPVAMSSGTLSRGTRSIVMWRSSGLWADAWRASRSRAMNTQECSSQKPGEL